MLGKIDHIKKASINDWWAYLPYPTDPIEKYSLYFLQWLDFIFALFAFFGGKEKRRKLKDIGVQTLLFFPWSICPLIDLPTLISSH